jgi:hypothetical protein
MANGKYGPLGRYLAGAGRSTQLRFGEIEEVLGFALPASARTYQAWWANDPHHVQAKAWLSAHARSGQVDLRGETVTFTKEGALPRRGETPVDSGVSKYAPLGSYLAVQYSSRVQLGFGEIERVLGFSLPASARKHRPWWANAAGNNPAARAWLDQGFRTEQVDLAKETLVFARVEESAMNIETQGMSEAVQPPVAAGSLLPHPAFGAMKGMITILPGVDLTAPADPEWADMLDDPNAWVGGLDDPKPDDR